MDVPTLRLVLRPIPELISLIPWWDPQPEGWYMTPWLSTPREQTISVRVEKIISQIVRISEDCVQSK